MRKLIVLATSLMILGVLVFGLSACSGGFGKGKYETNTYELSEDFNDISVNTDIADIVFLPSDDGKCKVVCYETKLLQHSAEIQNGTLNITVTDNRKWYNFISIGIGTPKITVYLPKAEYSSLKIEEDTGDVDIPSDFSFGGIDISLSTGDVKCNASSAGNIKISSSTGDIQCNVATANDVKISASTGDVSVGNISSSSLDISVSTGKVTVSDAVCEGNVEISVSTGKSYLTNVRCKNLISDGNTGDITLADVIASEKFNIERSTGDVKFEASDAAEILVKTDTGSVKGSLLSSKIFIIDTDTGKKDVPESLTGGKCKITTDTGDIKITVS